MATVQMTNDFKIVIHIYILKRIVPLRKNAVIYFHIRFYTVLSKINI